MSLKKILFTAEERKLFEHSFFVRHRLEEQYRDLQHQGETASLGMWVFLASEALFFGALFVIVAAYWVMYREAIEAASRALRWEIAAANTAVLLVSSYTMVLSVHFAKQGRSRLSGRWLCATAGLGMVFLALKGWEYAIDYREELIPGWRFNSDHWISAGLNREQVGPVRLFLAMYWVMTLLHAVHLSIGVAFLLLMAVLARRERFTAEYSSPVEVTGLYWHFVDLVWIFLFPTLYLIGGHGR